MAVYSTYVERPEDAKHLTNSEGKARYTLQACPQKLNGVSPIEYLRDAATTCDIRCDIRYRNRTRQLVPLTQTTPSGQTPRSHDAQSMGSMPTSSSYGRHETRRITDRTHDFAIGPTDQCLARRQSALSVVGAGRQLMVPSALWTKDMTSDIAVNCDSHDEPHGV